MPSRVGNHSGSPDYQSSQSFTDDSGYRTFPTASGAKLVQVHGGYGMRRVSFEATREGCPPIIPEQVDIGDDTYLTGNVMTVLPAVTERGRNIFSVAGEYTYLQGTSRKVGTHAIPCGNHPYGTGLVDAYATSLLPADVTAASASTTAGLTALMTTIVSGLIDVNKARQSYYVWPFNTIPVQAASDDLAG